jgi:hypothetical protein
MRFQKCSLDSDKLECELGGFPRPVKILVRAQSDGKISGNELVQALNILHAIIVAAPIRFDGYTGLKLIKITLHRHAPTSSIKAIWLKAVTQVSAN